MQNYTLAICFLLGSLLALSAQAELKPCGRCVSVLGVATVKGKTLAPGDSVTVGDEIKTSEKSSVKLLLGDRSIIDIGPNSIFRVTEYQLKPDGERTVDSTLDLGSVRANVTKKLEKKSRFFIRTRSSVLAVRGTEFFTRWGSSGNAIDHQVAVAEGELDYQPTGGGPPFPIAAGHQFTAPGPGGPNTPSPLTQQEVRDLFRRERFRDATFHQTVTLGDSRTGGETFGTLIGSIGGMGRDRRPASLGSRTGDLPAAIAQDAGNGQSPIPGFSGFPGTNLRPPSGQPPSGQFAFDLTVVLSP